jgi:hypothetical protein
LEDKNRNDMAAVVSSVCCVQCARSCEQGVLQLRFTERNLNGRARWARGIDFAA